MLRIAFVAAIAVLAPVAGGAQAQTGAKGSQEAAPKSGERGYPNRPLRYIVAFPAGGASDVVARIVAPVMGDYLGQQIVVDNRSGANGIIGAEIASRATPDGYTLFGCNIASLAVGPALYRKLSYDPGTAFAPIGFIGSNPNALSVNIAVPAANIAEFIALAKARPGQLNYGSAGVGTSPQLSMELFKMQARIDIVHVPYRGIGAMLLDLIAGQVQAMFSTVPSVLGSARGGKIRVLGVTSLTRAVELPDIPTIAESGMPSFEVISWQGLCVPAGVPQAVLAQIRAAFGKAIALPETRKRLLDQGFHCNAMTPEQFAAFISAERGKWAKVVNDVGIAPQ